MFGSSVVLGVGGQQESGSTRPAKVVRALWVESSAGRVYLDGSGAWSALEGPAGLTGAPFDLDAAGSPAFDGLVLRDDRPLVGQVEVMLPLVLEAASSVDAATQVAQLRRVTRWSVGHLHLVGTLSDGSTRRLLVRRVQADGDSWHPMSWVHDWRIVPLRLLALDPWWAGDERSITWAGDAGSGSFFPILPMNLAASAVLGGVNPLPVGGELETWPTWVIEGPCDSVSVARGDGRSFGFSEALGVGETLTVRSDPRGTGRVQHSVDGNWWQYLDAGSDLFPLRPDDEAVTVAAVNSTAATRVTVSWRPRFEALL